MPPSEIFSNPFFVGTSLDKCRGVTAEIVVCAMTTHFDHHYVPLFIASRKCAGMCTSTIHDCPSDFGESRNLFGCSLMRYMHSNNRFVALFNDATHTGNKSLA